MTHSPIIIFAFNRLDALKSSVSSLLANTEAKESDLFVFVDGARAERDGEDENVDGVRSFVKNITGFKSLHYEFSEHNRGLGPSIIRGVSKIINEYGCAIVLEDDLVYSTNFLAYMNEGLNLYKDNKQVFSICGYSNAIKYPYNYKFDAYFAPRSSSWGWATWKDRWNTVDWELHDWDCVYRNRKAFNRWGGSDCYGMLKGWKTGRNKSWAIRFCYAQFVQNAVSLFPVKSKVDNNGFDGQGTNCRRYSRFRCEMDSVLSKQFSFPIEIKIERNIVKSALSYHSILRRIWSKVMYAIYG